MAKKLAGMRATESDARLEDREAWALSVVELARARLRKAVAELEATLRCFVDSGGSPPVDGERASLPAAASRAATVTAG
jgi:hypothetical protein